ncbi:MAG TPA: hypothetical protein VGT41_03740 [Candidatus Babeliales bacterium]|nr:hypothetical protein [Candidatus Babeliales bacterium]
MQVTKIILYLLFFSSNCGVVFSAMDEEITPYKYTESERSRGLKYTIPASSRFTVTRFENSAPDVIYYFSEPKENNYPIAILCGGSSNKENVQSIIHFHRYFLQEFLDMNVAVLTVEQWGVDGDHVDLPAFMEHYTRSQRLWDHITVLQYLKLYPPAGWNGKVIFLGVSEGGPLVTTLTEQYSELTLATINWVGAGDWSWREELWRFVAEMKKQLPWWLKSWVKLCSLAPCWMHRYIPYMMELPRCRKEYDARMDQALEDPVVDKEFLGMSHMYHADALEYSLCNYTKLVTPFLVVVGTKDTILQSCDQFVMEATKAGCPITYFRVDGMDHWIRKRPDIIAASFQWLQVQIDEYNERNRQS